MKRLYACCILLIVALFIYSPALAQVSSMEQVTKEETHAFQLVPTNDGYKKSFPIQIESVGKVAGEISCQTEGSVPANYNHLVIILHQKNGTTLQTRDYIHFKNDASVSFDVNESGLNSGEEFIFTTRLNLANVSCNCNLDITFTESVPMEKITAPNIPIRQKAVDSGIKKDAAVPKITPKRSPIPDTK